MADREMTGTGGQPAHAAVLQAGPGESAPSSKAGHAPVALVTGGGRGIGAAVAAGLAGAGWRVAVLDACRDDPALAYPLATSADLDATAATCAEAFTRSAGTGAGARPGALALQADVRDLQALESAVGRATAELGGLDAVVAAAGAVAGGADAWLTSDEVWHVMLDVNLTGVWNTARATVPALLAAPEPRHGRFVALASAGSSVGLARLAAYSAAKHGVLGLVRSLAAELAGTGVTANAVAPGTTDTAMGRASAAVYGLRTEDLAEHHLDRRLLHTAEVAALVCWLCGPASSGVTGALLPVDLGMTAH